MLFAFLSIYVISLLFFPDIITVIEATISGKEASSADRTNNVSKALEYILTEPYGHGVGASNNRFQSEMVYFAESSIMNIMIELGVLGLLILLLIHIQIIKIISRNGRNECFFYVFMAIAISSIITCLFSINLYGIPYVYFWWIFLGLGINNTLLKEEKTYTVI